MGHFAKVGISKTVNRINEAPTSGSNTESCPEIDLIQSVKCINLVACSNKKFRGFEQKFNNTRGSKNGKKQRDTADTHYRKQKHTTTTGPGLVR